MAFRRGKGVTRKQLSFSMRKHATWLFPSQAASCLSEPNLRRYPARNRDHPDRRSAFGVQANLDLPLSNGGLRRTLDRSVCDYMPGSLRRQFTVSEEIV